MNGRKDGPWHDPLGWSVFVRKRLAVVLVLLFGVWALMPAPQRPSGKREDLWPPTNYLVYYGGWDDPKIKQAQQFDLVIAHPGQGFENIKSDQLRRLRLGADARPDTEDDVVVVGYISLGEQPSPPGGPRRAAVDGAGPVYREAGKLQFSGGYPTRFLDELTLQFEDGFPLRGFDGRPKTSLGHDGVPDENGVWGSFYVHPGDPGWQSWVMSRAQELVERGFDGFFLDTLDTAAPEGNYGYLATDMFNLVSALHQQHPQSYLVANRGFYLLREQRAAAFEMLDAVMFESLVTEWDWEASRGFSHRWLQANHGVLEELFRPSPEGAQPPLLLALDYLDPQQPEAPVFRHSRQELLGGIAHLSASGHPWLDRIFATEAHQFPEGGQPLPPPALDIEVGQRNGVTVFPLASELNDVYDLRFRQQQDRLPYHVWKSFSGPLHGLDPKHPVRLAARRLGPKRSQIGPWREWTVPLNPIAAAPPPPVIEAGDASVRLKRAESATDLEVRWGTIKSGRIESFQHLIWPALEPSLTLEQLDNDQHYGFQTALMGGGWSTLVTATPHSQQAPAAPAELQVQVAGQRVEFNWTAGGEGVTSYRLYCLRRQEHWRLPLRIPVGTQSTQLEELNPGEYRAFITSVDGRGYESQPGADASFSVFESAGSTPTLNP